MKIGISARRCFCLRRWTACLIAISSGVACADTPDVRHGLLTPVLDEQTAGGPPATLVYRSLRARMAGAGERLRRETDALGTPEALRAWQDRMRAQVLNALGGLPERAPLRARVTGSVAREGYRVEKVLFESRPAFFVTALLFLPDRERFAPPVPGVIVPCGHSANGKGLPAYQRAALLAAVNGVAALLYDPIDQGERLQGTPGRSGVHGHNDTGVLAALVGWNTATFRIGDGMRALDYLASRPEVDPARLGCMGNSGGGTLTTYLAALDPRIRAASPNCYLSSLQRVCEAIGPQDAEQNLFGQMAFGLEHAGWLLLRAPHPTRVGAAQKDFFPIDGTRQTFAEVRAVYERLGMADRIACVEAEGPHGWSEPLRQASVAWMSRWLGQGGTLRVPPETEMGLAAEEVRVTPQGQVARLPGARSVYDLLREEAARLEALRPALDRQGLAEAVRRCAKIAPVTALPIPVTRVCGVTPCDDQGSRGEIRRVLLTGSAGGMIPAVFVKPAVPRGAPVLVVDGAGKTNAVAEVAARMAEGRAVLVADLCGFGETYGSAHAFYGAENRDEELAVLAYLLGDSLVGLRAETLLVCARWLAAACGRERVELRAAGWAVTPALHAAAAEPGLFSRVTWQGEPPDWSGVIARGQRHRFADVVHGALRHYDLGDLRRHAASLRE